MLGRPVTAFFIPSLCVACRGSADSTSLLCGDCLADLESSGPVRGKPPPGVDRLVSCAGHDGVARSVLAAFKFQQLLEISGLIACRMCLALGEPGPGTLVVPVPASPVRRRLRGFDAAESLAGLIADEFALPLGRAGLRRVGTGRQRGRGRTGRLGSPPDIRAAKKISGPVLLVDDVTTTGATLSACATALRSSGAGSVEAVTFTSRL